MIQIRPRWPILATSVAALAYGISHYQIAGIEHLRLEPRPAAATQPDSNLPTSGHPFGFDFPKFASGLSPATPSVAPTTAVDPSTLPAWKDKLSIGEKFAMWQEKNTADIAPTALPSTAPGPSLPVSSPIPLPPGFLAATDSGPAPTVPPLLNPDGSSQLGAISGATSGAPVGENLSTQIASAPSGLGAVRRGVGGATFSRMGRGIRIASFNVQSLGPAKLAKAHVFESLVSILRQYDVVALQEIQSTRDDILPMLVDKLNQSGRAFDYLIGPRVGRSQPHDQFAIVFDTERVVTDRYQLYTVDDPDDLINFEPLVAWFRCKGAPEKEAFTFSLVNVRIHPDFVDAEQAMLPSLIDAISKDGRGEDDWIFVGSFSGGVSKLISLDQNSIRFAIRDMPTDVAGTRMLDSIFFSSRATTEYTGRSGAFDFLRKFNLSIEQALEISDHMPIWAEFSVVEGAEPGRVAPADPQSIY